VGKRKKEKCEFAWVKKKIRGERFRNRGREGKEKEESQAVSTKFRLFSTPRPFDCILNGKKVIGERGGKVFRNRPTISTV